MNIIAHRGASGPALENTLSAFRLAWEQQTDGIEMDVHLSKDGRIIVHHDPDTRRSANTDLIIAATHSTVLRKLNVAQWTDSGHATMPFLEEVLATAPPHKQILVEIKCGPEIAPALACVLQTHGSHLQQIALITTDIKTLLICRQALPSTPCYLLSRACQAPNGSGFQPHSLDLIELALKHQLTGLCPDHRCLTKEFITAAQKAGLRLITWTVNDPATALGLRDMGLDAITTDFPGRLRLALHELDKIHAAHSQTPPSVL